MPLLIFLVDSNVQSVIIGKDAIKKERNTNEFLFR